MAKPGPAVAALLALVDEAYDRRSWHGPNLRGSLRGLSAAAAAWRPSESRHSAWEIAVHAAYWKYAAWRRLTGEKRGSFARAGSNWFDAGARPTEAAGARTWRSSPRATTGCARRWRVSRTRTSRAPPPAAARRRAPRPRCAAHDLYHAGQIQLLKRLMPSRAAR